MRRRAAMTTLIDGDYAELLDLSERLHKIRASLLDAEERHRETIARCPHDARPSARNLIHYLALRSHDLRALQERLARVGLSSLGRSEAHVLAALDAVLAMLARATNSPATEALAGVPTFAEGSRLLDVSTRAVLGPTPEWRRVRIMVTLASEAADDADGVRELIARGTNLVRINCAHDDEDAWGRMIRNVRAASVALARPCIVTMDLAGPKIRTHAVRAPIPLAKGDHVLLTRAPDAAGVTTSVAISIPSVLDDLQPGHAVWFDDGKLGGVIEAMSAEGARIRITHARGGRAELLDDKGINFPDGILRVAGFTAKDRRDLAFVARNADVVSLSFAQHRADVRAVDECLRAEGGERLGLILKIETRPGFDALPRMLLDALGTRPLGVMIARGDLALEIGYERMAEVQEEILWISEAAHVPVIWATQVLERMTKDGVPTRAEVTDAAMAERAECVMLNKGKHVLEAVTALDDILRRMEAHQHKKSSTLRPLHLSRALVEQ
jgi:pyruvate kinase